jgi:hypothetical protein
MPATDSTPTSRSDTHTVTGQLSVSDGTVISITDSYELAVSKGHVVIQGRNIWHSKDAVFFLRLEPTLWSRLSGRPTFRVREYTPRNSVSGA